MYNDLTRGTSTDDIDIVVQHDEHQLEALTELNRLRNELLRYEPPPQKVLPDKASSESQQESSLFAGFFFSSAMTKVTQTFSATAAPRGVYLHGGVGCGKTFCMNLFYESIEGTIWEHDRQKVHYHQFMLGIHQKMHEAKMKHKGIKNGDAVLNHVVEQTLHNGRLLCLDEFQVTDVADALILRRLFTNMLQQGAVVVATSNRPPQDLYLNGLQRDLFLPFIDLLEEKLAVVSMWDSIVDYRLIQKAASTSDTARGGGVYFVGQGEGLEEFEQVYSMVTKNKTMTATKLTTLGRQVQIPRASTRAGIARFRFEDLCQKALGAADYLVIAQNFNTVFVQNVPKLHLHEINWVRRFIIFIDAMYEHNVKLVIQAHVKPEELFVLDEETKFVDEVFSFDRTTSRLYEMSSDTYLKHKWTGGGDTSKVTPQVELLVEPS